MTSVAGIMTLQLGTPWLTLTKMCITSSKWNHSWHRSQGNTFTVATKFMPFKWGSKCDYETVKKSLLGSLDRLGLSYVDLYYIHRQVSLESSLEFAASAKRLKEEGLIKGVGFSEVCGAWIRELNSVVKLTAVQQEWSLVTRNLEEEMVPVCKELDIRIVAYSPLARNLLAVELTETPKDWRGSLPRYQPGNLAKNAALLAEVVALAKTKGCTAAQLSLAWLLEKGAQLGVTVVPIPGTTSLQHATDNINSANINLNDADMAVLEELGAKVSGLRADERYMKMGIEGQLAASEKAVS